MRKRRPRLLALAARRPTLLVVDDIDRGSDATLLALLMAAQRSAEARTSLAVVVAFDGDALPPTSRHRVAFASASGALLRVELGPLPRTELRRMLTSLFGEGVVPAAEQDAIAQQVPRHGRGSEEAVW